jgi:hypothetical protein
VPRFPGSVQTTENASLGGPAKAVVGGAVESAINPFAKLNKVAKLANAASKIIGKVPKASRAAKQIAQRVAPRAQRARTATSCAVRHSFDGTTSVTLADGTRVPIDSLAVGDAVLAWNESTGTTGAYPITAVWAHGRSGHRLCRYQRRGHRHNPGPPVLHRGARLGRGGRALGR